MKTIHLHGSLGEQFGTEFHLDISTPLEGIRALCVQLKGFRAALNDGFFEVHRGDRPVLHENMDVLAVTMNRVDDLHIIPVLEGAKDGGKGAGGKILLGAVLVATAVVTAGGAVGGVGALFSSNTATGAAFAGTNVIGGISAAQVALVGGVMVLGGVSQLISPVPEVGGYEEREDQRVQRNGLLGGKGNTSQQGAAIPVVFGRKRVGSHTIQVSMIAEQLAPVEYVESTNKKKLEILSGTRVYDSKTYIGAMPEMYVPPWFLLMQWGQNEEAEDDIIDAYGTWQGSEAPEFRGKPIRQIAQVQEGSNYFLDVVMGGGLGGGLNSSANKLSKTEFFDRIRIVRKSDQQEMQNQVTLSVNTFETDYAIPPAPAPTGGIGISQPRRWSFYRWRWNLGASPAFPLVDSVEYEIFLEYTK